MKLAVENKEVQMLYGRLPILEMLESADSNQRFQACNELRAANSLPIDDIRALRKATGDLDPEVAAAARKALDAHRFSYSASYLDPFPILEVRNNTGQSEQMEETMPSLSNDKVPKALKIIALLLIGGGIFGTVMVLSGDLQTPSQQPVNVFFAIVFAAVFGLCVWVGVRLWGGKPGGVRWAKILFAAQIPILSIPHFFAYEFYSGLTIHFMLEQIDTLLDFSFSFYFGAGMQFIISPEIQNLTLGINLVAVIVLLYLNKVSKSLSSPVTLSEIPSEAR